MSLVCCSVVDASDTARKKSQGRSEDVATLLVHDAESGERSRSVSGGTGLSLSDLFSDLSENVRHPGV